MAIPIVPLEPSQSGPAAAVMANAFYDDDLFCAMFRDPSSRPAKTEAYSRWTIQAHLVSGAVVETTQSLRGVCVWEPPGHVFSWSMGVRLLPETARMLWATGRDTRRSLGWFSNEERRRQALIPEPHWFLVMLGVEPAAQRFGLGAALALHGLARADAEGRPAYVITNSEGNAALYRKMGFELAEKTEAADDALGVPTWRMLRPRP